jgi:integrase
VACVAKPDTILAWHRRFMARKLDGSLAKVPHSFRTRSGTPVLTRWANILDPYTLAYLAGHSDFATTRRYVHPNLNTARDSKSA